MPIGLPGLSSYLDELIGNCILWYMVHPNKVNPQYSSSAYMMHCLLKVVLPLEAWWYPEESLDDHAACEFHPTIYNPSHLCVKLKQGSERLLKVW